MSGDLSAEVTAIATAALAVFAIITAAFAFLAYRKQTQEVGVLRKQNDRDIAERRTAQAARVFAEITGDIPGRPYAKNGSDFPIFDAQLWYSEPGGVSGPDELGSIMPGGTAKITRQLHVGEALTGPILTFRDAAGIRWIRIPDGTLKEQSGAITHVSVLTALGVEVPGPHPRPPGPDGGHNLPTAFRRLDDQITGPVLDSIMIYPESRGILSMPGKGGIWARMQTHLVEVISSDPDNQGVYTDERRVDEPPQRYRVICDVWNYRDSPACAKTILVELTKQGPPETPE